MADQKEMLDHARNVLRASKECDEASLRTLLTVRFLHDGESNPGEGGGAGGGDVMALFFVCLWPLFFFKWLSFRRRAREFTVELDAVILIVRNEGLLPPATRGDGTP